MPQQLQLSVSPVGNLFAAGQDSGVVNIYNRDKFLSGKRKPVKDIENLTTRVDFMKFNPDAQILAISSCMKKNSMKLIHVLSLTAFSNWLAPNQALHYPSCMDFSPHGGFMAMGNAAGKCICTTFISIIRPSCQLPRVVTFCFFVVAAKIFIRGERQ